jgi:cytoskeletal protein CcmA (bactofilin family)
MAFGPSKGSAESKTASVFAHDLIVRGDVENQGDLRVEGQLHGNVSGQGTITVAEQGQVVGNIEGREVIVMGRIEGNVKATDKVEVLEKSTVKGEVSSARISLEDGATVSGKFDTMPHDAVAGTSETSK